MALIILELRASSPKLGQRPPEHSHTNGLVIALVEFHKAQCYFSTVIQIPALALYNRIDKTSTLTFVAFYDENYFDTSVMIVLASSALIPISLTLACITRYGRQSWYLLTLSWISAILGLTTSISSYYWAHERRKCGELDDDRLYLPWSSPLDSSSDGLQSCDLTGISVSDTVIPLCGNSELLSNALPYEMIDNWWTWLICINCFVWMSICLAKKCWHIDRLSALRENLRACLLGDSCYKFAANESKSVRTWILVAVLAWTPCFAWQFYLFSAYFEHQIIIHLVLWSNHCRFHMGTSNR